MHFGAFFRWFSTRDFGQKDGLKPWLLESAVADGRCFVAPAE